MKNGFLKTNVCIVQLGVGQVGSSKSSTFAVGLGENGTAQVRAVCKVGARKRLIVVINERLIISQGRLCGQERGGEQQRGDGELLRGERPSWRGS